tara:strand:+ start:329 stop:613 length:285 start_codon:yes stop_codon:yes gene_type:complete
MKLIDIKKIKESEFSVTVTKETITRHTVFVSESTFSTFGNGKLTKEQLIKKSFLFLLQREPQSSILQTFDLSEIANYFPEYENIANIGWIDVSG